MTRLALAAAAVAAALIALNVAACAAATAFDRALYEAPRKAQS